MKENGGVECRCWGEAGEHHQCEECKPTRDEWSEARYGDVKIRTYYHGTLRNDRSYRVSWCSLSEPPILSMYSRVPLACFGFYLYGLSFIDASSLAIN